MNPKESVNIPEETTSGYLRLTERWQQALVYDVYQQIGFKQSTLLTSYFLEDITLDYLRRNLNHQDIKSIKRLAIKRSINLMI